MRGTLELYSGVRPADACGAGDVLVQTKLGTKTLSARRGHVSRTCTWHVSVAFHHSLKRHHLRFVVRFLGNDVLRRTAAVTRRGTAR